MAVSMLVSNWNPFFPPGENAAYAESILSVDEESLRHQQHQQYEDNMLAIAIKLSKKQQIAENSARILHLQIRLLELGVKPRSSENLLIRTS